MISLLFFPRRPHYRSSEVFESHVRNVWHHLHRKVTQHGHLRPCTQAYYKPAYFYTYNFLYQYYKHYYQD